MDAFLLARLSQELDERWSGAWVQQAWQDQWGRVVLRLRDSGASATAFLLLSPLPVAQGFGLLPRRPPCPPRPPRVAAYLRAHLTGGRLVSARCPAFERVVELGFRVRRSAVRLVLEATGRSGNLFILDEDGLVRVSWRRSRFEVGQLYSHPARPPDLHLPDEVIPGEAASWVAAGEPLHRRLLGLSPTLGREIAHRGEVEGVEAAYRGLFGAYRCRGPVFAYPELLSAVPLTHRQPAEAAHQEALCVAGERLERDLERERAAEAERERRSAERSRERKLERRVARIREDLSRLPDPSSLRREADALAAHLTLVPRNASAVTIADPWTADGTLLVSLDPSLPPARNLERLYERARRAERARNLLQERLAAAEAELSAPAGNEPAGHTESPGRTVGALSLPYRRYRSSDGWTIWVGRNSRENDRLLREARPWDMWLHARDARGAHVLVRLPGREARVPERTLVEAAGLAARHSNRAGEAAAEVMVAEAGRVRKPKGSSPGRVTVSGERTLLVSPGAGNPVPT